MIRNEVLASELRGRHLIMVGKRDLLADLLASYLSSGFGCAVNHLRWEELSESKELLVGGSFIVALRGSDADETQAVKKVREKDPKARIVLLLDVFGNHNFHPQLTEYVSGVILSSYPLDRVCLILSMIFSGETYFPKELYSVAMMECENKIAALTTRERKVLGQLAYGRSNNVIAEKLGISSATVKMHISSALRKTGAGNRAQLAILAHNRGIFPTDPEDRPDKDDYLVGGSRNVSWG